MSIPLMSLFAAAMMMAVLAFRGPPAVAGPAWVLCGLSLVAFLAGIVAWGIRRPVV